VDFGELIFPVWLFLVFWVFVSGVLGITTKKERLCIYTLIDVIAVCSSVEAFIEASHTYSHVIWVLFIYLNGKNARRHYKEWQRTDDDDDWKQRRKSWGKSHLPKPVTRAIPQPV